MKGAPGGFTIIEVMIVLAISSAMLISAAAIFNGRRQSTEFSQAMYDLQSQVQSIANNVSSQAVPGIEQYTCAPMLIGGVMRPALTAGGSTNQDCIYLGKVIQVKSDSSDINIYPIFGLRTVYNASVDTGDTSSTIPDAHIEPAISASGVAANPNDPANLLLVEKYVMLNGLKTVSATISGAENDILGLLSSLQDANTSGNEIQAIAANYSGAATDPGLQIKECVEGSCYAGSSPISNTAWKLCVTNGSRQAQLSVKSIATGLVTSLNMNGCT